MTSVGTAIQIDNRLRRCAVCKIDLKGRFVYIDEEIENLLGFTKEELFGKSISDFLHGESQLLIESVLTHRNHYESFYDATEITVVDRHKTAISTTAIISLNFIAGNPVNYQLIINREDVNPAVKERSVELDRNEQFLISLLDMKSVQDMNEVAEQLRQFILAESVYVYLISENDLEPRACSSSFEQGDFSFESIPAPNDLHRAVAASGETYDNSDESSVRKAVELLGEAPGGLICRCEFGPGSAYLFCVHFDPESDFGNTSEARKKLEIGLNLIERLIHAEKSSASDDQNVDVKFTVGFLDSLGIGAALIGEEGQIAGYNPSCMSLLETESLSGNYADLLELLAADNSETQLSQLHSFMGGEAGPDSGADLEMEVVCPDGHRANLTVLRFSFDTADKSCCITLVPQSVSDTNSPPVAVDDDLIGKIISNLGEPLDDLYQVSQRLAHENYSEIGESGRGKLRRLVTQSSRLKLLLLDIMNSEKLSCSQQREQTVDLGLTLDEQIVAARQKHPTVEFNCRFDSLPLLQADPEVVGRIFEVLFEHSIRLNGENRLDLDLDVAVTETDCTLRLEHPVASLHAALQSPQKSGRKAISSNVAAVEVETLSALLALRYLIERGGGLLKVRSVSKKNFCIDITLPMA
ncbi:MAG: PAS domain-containing protein [bacterium]|nr:PAS domain-containing protein [bacterium]